MNNDMCASEVNEWRPIKFYFAEKGKHDWALVRFEEKASGFAGIPHICEWRTSGKFGAGWYLQDGEDDKAMFEYLNDFCSAIAFLEWPQAPVFEWPEAPECFAYIDEEREMTIKFKDGKEIKFKKFGKIWLADSVIFEVNELCSFLKEIRLVKAKISQWFDENAPEEIREKYNARLPLWREIEVLPSFKDQIAYGEGRTDRISDYLLGDGNDLDAIAYYVGYCYDRGFISCDHDYVCAGARPVRLCLEGK